VAKFAEAQITNVPESSTTSEEVSSTINSEGEEKTKVNITIGYLPAFKGNLVNRMVRQVCL
jgi:hypothetical protein